MSINSAQFPNDLIQRYLSASIKLKKFERVVFKRFAPNVAEVSNDFGSLAVKFDDACMYQYSAMCYLGASKCEKSLGNSATETDFLLKSARAFVKADKEIEKLGLRSNNHEYIEGALKSYELALAKYEEDSPVKAAIIREIRKINPNCEHTSSFSSPCHRTYDLDKSANESIRSKDHVSALDKLTEIVENMMERKVKDLYIDVMNRIEITRLLLLLVLDLPPSRQSPSHIKLFEKYSQTQSNYRSTEFHTGFYIPEVIQLHLRDLVLSCCDKDNESVLSSIGELLKCSSFTTEHRQLLKELANIYRI